MAKVKPQRVPVLLEGGPCDGRKTTARRTVDLLDSVTCKGATYDPTDRVTKDNRVVYTTRASQQPPQPPPQPPATKRSHAHAAWHHLMHTTFVRAPQELRGAEHAREAIRGLRRRHGLR